MLTVKRKSITIGKTHLVQTPGGGVMRAKGSRDYRGYHRRGSLVAVLANALIEWRRTK